MKTIEKRVKAIGSLTSMDQAVRLITNLGGVVIEMKEIKVEWCENFIRAAFTKHHAFPGPNAGIEINCFWDMAERAGLWVRGTYDSPMSQTLENLVEVEAVSQDGKFRYHVFRLAQ